MNCEFVRDHLFAFSEGSLVPQDEERYLRHLEECPSCKLLNDQVSATLRSALPNEPVKSNPFLSTRIMQRLENEFMQPTRLPSWVRIVQPALLTAALVAGILIGSMTARRSEVDQNLSAGPSIQELRSDLFIQSFAEEAHIDEISK